MAATPTLTVESLFVGTGPTLVVYEAGSIPSSINIGALTPVAITLAVTGTVTTTFSGNTTTGSYDITGVASTTGLAAGQPIVAAGLQADGSGGGGLPVGSTISAISGTTVTFTNGAPGGSQPAYASTSSLSIVASDPFPLGYLAVTTSPTTGVAITDDNADGAGTGGGDNTGDGGAIQNEAGQASGDVHLSFGGFGTFDVLVAFTSDDANYSSLAAASVLTVVVS